MGLWGLRHVVAMVALCLVVLRSRRTEGLRLWIDEGEECFSQGAKYEGDSFHVSFVVIQDNSPWHHSASADGIDLVIKGPSGEQILDFRDRKSLTIGFIAPGKGIYHFCFINKSPYHESIDFNVHVGHFKSLKPSEQHLQDAHVTPLLEQIAKLEEALDNIVFEQHWLKAETYRQAIVNDGMSRRAIHKAVIESVALVGANVLQVYLLKRLFNRKLGASVLKV
ncbi:hypothetical protein FH972_014214 [Carpinus fangiana]|uniref:GOLD domain-containing protein n=1 Tax=Carpinus fangiana TaxID=176857 RepID=A0A5N6RA48_9ROSI|nr:hypothetical protein FH972_014214 [Carpinus fangiana]